MLYFIIFILIARWLVDTTRDSYLLEGSPCTRSPSIFYGKVIARIMFANFIVFEIVTHWSA